MFWSGGSARLYGRDKDLMVLQEFLAQSRRSGASLALHGLPGVGVTALLEHLRQLALASGFTVLDVAGHIVGARGFDCPRQLVELLTANLPDEHLPAVWALRATIDDADSRPFDAELARTLTTDLTALIRLLPRPTLIMTEDGPPDELMGPQVLSEVARHIQEPGLALAGSTRAADVGLLPAQMRVHEVRPISDQAARELLTEEHPDLPDPVRIWLLREADGNPLALQDIPAPTSWPQPQMPAFPLGERVRHAYDVRLAALPTGTRDVLLLAALDRGNDLIRLSSTGGLPDVRAALAPAVAAGLTTIDPDGRVRFGHRLVRRAVVDLATAEQRREAHTTWAQVLRDVDPLRSTHHRAEAATGPDENVARALEELAQRARDHGDELGVMAISSKAAQLSENAAERARRLTDAAYTGALYGRLSSASDLMSDARRAHAGVSGSPAESATAAFEQLNGGGDVDTSWGLLAHAIDAIDDPGDSADGDLALLLRTLFHVCLLADRGDVWTDFGRRMESLREPVPEDLLLARATARLGCGPASDRTGDDLVVLGGAIARARVQDPAIDLIWVTGSAVVLRRANELGPVLMARLPQLLDDAHGTRMHLEIQIAYAEMLAGNWDEALEVVRAGLDRAQHNEPDLTSWSLTAVRAQIAAFRGNLVTARALSDTLMAWAGPRAIGAATNFVLQIRNAAATAEGDYEESFRLLEMITPIGSLNYRMSSPAATLMDLVQAAMRTDRQQLAQQHVQAAQEAQIPRLSPYFAMLVDAAAALAAGPVPEADKLFERALSGAEAGSWPFDGARIRLAYGEHLRRTGAVSRAREQLTLAREVFDRLGAQPWILRATAELEVAGAPVQPATAGPRALLSPQERQIALLAATGLTNKQIAEKLALSPRTVSNHLHRAFPKLAITSRAGLRGALTALGLSPISVVGTGEDSHGESVAQPGPGSDPEFRVDPVQVVAHGPRREQKFPADLLVREPARRELGDPQFLRGQVGVTGPVEEPGRGALPGGA